MRANTLFVTALAVAAGCGPGLDAPPQVRYGEDACAECRMIINDSRFAAAYANEQGQWRKFDDIGCLLLYWRRAGEGATRVWVRSFGGDAWLDAEHAVFVRSKRIETPMGYGLAAVSSRQDAMELTTKVAGESLTFRQVNQLVIEKGSK